MWTFLKKIILTLPSHHYTTHILSSFRSILSFPNIPSNRLPSHSLLSADGTLQAFAYPINFVTHRSTMFSHRRWWPLRPAFSNYFLNIIQRALGCKFFYLLMSKLTLLSSNHSLKFSSFHEYLILADLSLPSPLSSDIRVFFSSASSSSYHSLKSLGPKASFLRWQFLQCHDSN